MQSRKRAKQNGREGPLIDHFTANEIASNVVHLAQLTQRVLRHRVVTDATGESERAVDSV
jgi:hypothetical protein